MTHSSTGIQRKQSAPGFLERQPIVIIGIIFFVIGFVTWLGSVLIPYLRITCQINYTSSLLVAFAFYISYLIMALPLGWVLKQTGFKNGMALGLCIMALGTLLFVPAALTRTFWIFLTGLFVQGAGLTILQTAANPYVTIIGKRESAAKRISIMGFCNGTASALSPLILGAFILSNTDGIQEKLKRVGPQEQAALLHALGNRIIAPYLVFMVVLFAIAFLIKYSGLPEAHEEVAEADTEQPPVTKRSIFQFPHLLLGVVTIFVYVGMEVISGDTIINYGTSQGIPLSTARLFSSATQGCMLVGYIFGILCIPKFITQSKALILSTLLALVFAMAAIFTKGFLSVCFIALLGLANSLIWPSVWPLAIAGLGKFTKLGSSLLVMAISGGAILPLLYGQLAEGFNTRLAYWIVVPCYLFIFYYGVWGNKIRTK